MTPKVVENAETLLNSTGIGTKEAEFAKKENNVMTSSSSGYSSNRVPLPQLLSNNMGNKIRIVATTTSILICFKTYLAPDSILEADSLEADLVLEDSSFEDSIQNVPAPIWPSSAATTTTILSTAENGLFENDSNYVSKISFSNKAEKPNDEDKGTLEVTRNGTFVRSIQFHKHNRIRPVMGFKVPKMLEPLTPIGEVQNDSRFEDSIVTESLLQMTSFSDNNLDLANNLQVIEMPNPNPNNPKKEDMDRVIAELTQGLIKSKNITTLTRAMKSKDNSGNFSRGKKLRNSLKALKIKHSSGIEAVKDLWQQSGMKTNGRKLLTDSLSEEDEKSNHHFNRKQPKRVKKSQSKSIYDHGKLSSSSSASEGTSPPYRSVLNCKRSVSLTSSTELYAEVYRTSSGESSQSPL